MRPMSSSFPSFCTLFARFLHGDLASLRSGGSDRRHTEDMPGVRMACQLLTLLTLASQCMPLSEAASGDTALSMLDDAQLGQDGPEKRVPPLKLRAPVQQVLRSHMADGPSPPAQPARKPVAAASQGAAKEAAEKEQAAFAERVSESKAEEHAAKVSARTSRERARKAVQPQSTKDDRVQQSEAMRKGGDDSEEEKEAKWAKQQDQQQADAHARQSQEKQRKTAGYEENANDPKHVPDVKAIMHMGRKKMHQYIKTATSSLTTHGNEEPHRKEVDENEEKPHKKEVDENEEKPHRKEVDENEEKPHMKEVDENEEKPHRKEVDENEEKPHRKEVDENEEKPRKTSKQAKEDRGHQAAAEKEGKLRDAKKKHEEATKKANELQEKHAAAEKAAEKHDEFADFNNKLDRLRKDATERTTKAGNNREEELGESGRTLPVYELAADAQAADARSEQRRVDKRNSRLERDEKARIQQDELALANPELADEALKANKQHIPTAANRDPEREETQSAGNSAGSSVKDATSELRKPPEADHVRVIGDGTPTAVDRDPGRKEMQSAGNSPDSSDERAMLALSKLPEADPVRVVGYGVEQDIKDSKERNLERDTKDLISAARAVAKSPAGRSDTGNEKIAIDAVAQDLSQALKHKKHKHESHQSPAPHRKSRHSGSAHAGLTQTNSMRAGAAHRNSMGSKMASTLSKTSSLVQQMKASKVQADARAVLQHLKEDVTEADAGTLPTKETLAELGADGKTIFQESKKVSGMAADIQHADEPALLSLSGTMQKVHAAIAAREAQHPHQQKPEAKQSNAGSPKAPQKKGINEDLEFAGSPKAPQNEDLEKISSWAKASIRFDDQQRRVNARSALYKLRAVQWRLARDMKHAPADKATELSQEMKELKAEVSEFKREMAFDPKQHIGNGAPVPKVTSKNTEASLDAMEKSADKLIDSEVKNVEKRSVQQAAEIRKDAEKFESKIAKSAQMKLALAHLKKADAEIAEREAAVAHSIMDSALEGPTVSLLQEAVSPAQSPTPIDLSPMHKENPPLSKLHKETVQDMLQHPLAKLQKHLNESLTALKNAGDVVSKQIELDCMHQPQKIGCAFNVTITDTITDTNGTDDQVAEQLKNDTKKVLAAKQQLQEAQAKLAKETHSKYVEKKAVALAKLNAAKEDQEKKKFALVDALKGLEKSEEARATEARKEQKKQVQRLKERKEADLQAETRLNEARFVTNYIKKAKADVETMKIVNPVQGAIDKAKKEIESARAENMKDISLAQQAAAKAAAAAKAYDIQVDVSSDSPEAQAAGKALREADLHFDQELALSHLSKHEVMDATDNLEKQEATYNALQLRLEKKKADLVQAAETKAKAEAPKIWKEKLSEMKARIKAKSDEVNQQQNATKVEGAAAGKTASNNTATGAAGAGAAAAQDIKKQQNATDAEIMAERHRVAQQEVERDQQQREEAAARTREKEEAVSKENKQKAQEKDPAQQTPTPKLLLKEPLQTQQEESQKQEPTNSVAAASDTISSDMKQVEKAEAQAADAGADVKGLANQPNGRR